MKLLLDQNLSPRLAQRLASVYPGSEHVSSVGLATALDSEVWRFARDQGFTLVSKDADFCELSLLLGAPPKVIWLRVGNCTTTEVENLLKGHRDSIGDLDADPNTAILTIG